MPKFDTSNLGNSSSPSNEPAGSFQIDHSVLQREAKRRQGIIGRKKMANQLYKKWKANDDFVKSTTGTLLTSFNKFKVPVLIGVLAIGGFIYYKLKK